MAIENSQIIEILNGEADAEAKATSLQELFSKDFENEKNRILVNKEQIKEEKKAEIDKRHAVEDEKKKLEEQLATLQEQLKATSPEEIQKVYESRLSDAKQVFDTQMSELKTKLEASEKSVQALNQEKFKLSCMEEFNKAIAGKNIDPSSVSDLSLFVLGPDCVKFSKKSLGDGTDLIVTEDGQTVKSVLDDVLNNTSFGKRCVVVNTTGGGAEGGSKTIPTGVKNPWKKETYNLTKQAELLRDDPALAAALKAQANQ